MDEYNFEPDFEKWWNKKSLSEEDLSILIFGLNPDQFKKYIEIGNRERNDEERNFLDNYHAYISSQKQHNDIYKIDELRSLLLKESYWGRGKKNFIKNVYENGLAYSGEQISEKFVSYLSSIGEMPNHFDQYKDFSKYRADISLIEFKNIKTEDEAFSYLLGLSPEYFYKFKKYIDDRRIKKIEWKEIDLETRFFSQQYFLFIRQEYGFLDIFGEEILFKAYRFAKSLNLWDGIFSNYVQCLYDEGFIFRSNIYEKLGGLGIKPTYSKNSWAEQFYKRWIKEKLWTLDESQSLFKGQSPIKGRSFHDLSQNSWSFSNNLFWESFDEKFLEIDKRIERCIVSGTLDIKNIEGKTYFYPKKIVSWMLENFVYAPPSILLELLFNNYEQSRLVNEIPQSIKEKIVPSPLTHTGSAGRPNAKTLYLNEMKRRAERGELESSVKREAAALLEFIKRQELEIALPTPKSIENAIRDDYRNLKGIK